MTEETRKDARAKIVSLNVRYKSATVDEFIENHSYDVSKGGVFIKTATPFAPGTLLKFEIRIAGDVAVIGGVGRVVWKRDAAHATAEIPAGMGVKFIKLDDSSRATIEKLVQVKGDVKSAFDLGADAAPAAAAAGTPATEPKASAVPPPLLPPPQHPPQRRPSSGHRHDILDRAIDRGLGRPVDIEGATDVGIGGEAGGEIGRAGLAAEHHGA